MYCVKCGVRLADTEKQCPLCQTAVFHPDIERPPAGKLYPAVDPRQRPKSKGVQVLLTILCLLPALIVLLCDYQINDDIVWSGYVIGALVILYVSFILPLWFRNPNPVVFAPCCFAAIGAYLLYINWRTGGNWFLTLAFPLTGGVCMIVTAVVTLMRYVPKGGLYIFGGASIALGMFMVLVEYLVDITFHIERFFGWSLYPLIVLGLLGGGLIYLGASRTAREILERKFFI